MYNTMKKSVRTQDLFDLILVNPNKMFEVRLLISRFFVATHFIYFNNRNVYDEGIDGEKRKVDREEFLRNYQNNYWLIDNILKFKYEYGYETTGKRME